MRPVVLAVVVALSSSRAACGTLGNTISTHEHGEAIAKQQARIDELSRELAQTRAELAASRTNAAAQRDWSYDQIKKLADRVSQLENELATMKRQQER